jgi:hypothetical protein
MMQAVLFSIPRCQGCSNQSQGLWDFEIGSNQNLKENSDFLETDLGLNLNQKFSSEVSLDSKFQVKYQ